MPDYLTLAGAALLLWILPLLSPSRTFSRLYGSLFLLAYCAYFTYVILSA